MVRFGEKGGAKLRLFIFQHHQLSTINATIFFKENH